MANKNLFRSIVGKLVPKADALNSEQAPAYAYDAKHALAQYAATGCFGGTYYADAQAQLDMVRKLATALDGEFVAKTAVYARRRGLMKDMPAVLCAILAARRDERFERAFDAAIDDGRMLRNFVQVVRSGVTGRKSFGSRPRRAIRRWLESKSDMAVFAASVGNSPSMADVVRLVHPRPATASRRALYAWMLSRKEGIEELPGFIKEIESFRNGESLAVPDVPFLMLAGMPLSQADWARVATRMGWQATRINLNTLARHGAFGRTVEVDGVAMQVDRIVADRLRDRNEIRKAKAMPHQLLAAWKNVDSSVPAAVRDALQDALEIALENVPVMRGKVVVCVDVSGSMSQPVTGSRGSATSVVTCVDTAALIAAAILRRNPDARVIPFEQKVVSSLRLNARDSVVTNAERLAAVGGGGTNCSAPVALLNYEGASADLVIFVSDNESWVDAGRSRFGTALMAEWIKFKRRNPRAKLACIDLVPNRTTQAKESADILNIGGFSDVVFEMLAAFAAGEMTPAHWVGEIERTVI